MKKGGLWYLLVSALIVGVFMLVTVMVTGQRMLTELEKQEPQKVEPEYDRSLTPEQQLMSDISKMQILTVHKYSVDTRILEAPEIEIVPEEITETKASVLVPEDSEPKSDPQSIPEPDLDLVLEKVTGEQLRYNPTEIERQWAVFVTFAESVDQGFWGQVFVADVAINIAINDGKDLVYVYKHYGFSPVKNGVPTYYDSEKKKRVPVTWDVIPQEVIDAVDLAFRKDYTEELLKEVAVKEGLDSSYYEGGALFFDNPDAISAGARRERANIKVRFYHKDHEFFRIWDK